MDVPYLIKKLWMNASDETTLKKNLVEVNLPQSWPWKQNGANVVAAVIILKVVNNWRIVLKINILKRKLCLEFYLPSVKGNVCYHYNTWVTGIYVVYMFDKKTEEKTSQSEWFSLSALQRLASSEPQLQRELACKIGHCYTFDSHTTLFLIFQGNNSGKIYPEPKFFVILWILRTSKDPCKVKTINSKI